MDPTKEKEILASFRAYLSLAQFYCERLIAGAVLLLYLVILVAILAHGIHLGTWTTSGGGEHVYLYSFAVFLLAPLIYERMRHLR